MTLILSLLLSFAMLFAAIGAPLVETEKETSASHAVAAMAKNHEPRARDVQTSPTSAIYTPTAGSFSDFEYEHYDTDVFIDAADSLRELADNGDAQGAVELYDDLYGELLYIDALSIYAELRYYDDIYDDYWSDEYSYTNEALPLVQDAFDGACCHVLSSDCADVFEEHIGERAAEYFRAWEPLTDEQLEAYDREVELIDEYYNVYDGVYDLPYDYRGETWTYDKLSGYRGDLLYEKDPDGYFTVYYGLQQTMVETIAPIYIELIGLWKQEAADAGYDSYAEYAYTEIYQRDYSPEDAQILCDAIKPIAREYYADLYYSDMYYAAAEAQPQMDTDELLAVLGEYLPRVDESLLEPWRLLTEQSLYDISSGSSGRFDGAFTVEVPYNGTPYMYATLTDDCYDLFTLSHEFGHFSNSYFHPIPNAVTDADDLDLCEIHSNGLQALFTAFYDDIFDEGAEAAEFANLDFLLSNVLDGCVYDEFQRRVFEEDDELTAALLNEIFQDVCDEYGMYDGMAERPLWDAGWALIPHNFESPFYYFSYAASAIAALQIWDMAQSDYDAAVDAYLSVLGHNAYEQGYFEVLSDCGLLLFTEPGTAEAACRPVLDRLTRLDRIYNLSW